jgi:phenylalanyl-tRNA synthetase beta chain
MREICTVYTIRTQDYGAVWYERFPLCFAAMKMSIAWLRRYLSGSAISPEAAERALMDLGLPSESREAVVTCVGEDVCLDVEVTSNRGDCLSHVGLARELAASNLGVSLVMPVAEPAAVDTTAVSGVFALENTVPNLCPRFLVKVIRGVKVGESPAWLRASLEAIGQRPINNVVDVTNFVAAELGNPCHVFDMKKMAGSKIVVRCARDGEMLTTLDGKQRKLKSDEVVVADAERAQGLAGVMGGADSEVSSATVDVVLEMATWDPVAVRRARRRHVLTTAAAYRYERIVDQRTLAFAAERAAALIVEVAGGKVLSGTLSAGAPEANPTTVRFRPSRCVALLGYDIATDRIVRHLRAVGVEVGPLGRSGDDLLCTVPVHRPDLTREVDLIEEVARIEGLDAAKVQEKMSIRVTSPQASERARRDIASVLTGLGFFETVTFSFTTPKLGKAFVAKDLSAVIMDDARRGDEPALRPSVLTGLLACRRTNQHNGVKQNGGVRLFELSAAFAEKPGAAKGQPADSVEAFNIGLVLDCPGRGLDDVRTGVRMMRGAIESLVATLAGDAAMLGVQPATPHASAFDGAAYAKLTLAGKDLGYFATLEKSVLASFDLAVPVVCAEISLAALVAHYPPKSKVVLPPAFPGVERDVSLIVDEGVRWNAIDGAIAKHRSAPMVDHAFVTTYRGKPLAAGKKSVTVTLAYRDDKRTLTTEEVDAAERAMLSKLKGDVAFELRA